MLTKTLTRYSDNFVSRWLILAIDVFIVSCTYFLTYFILSNFEFDSVDWVRVIKNQPISILTYLVSFLMFKSYSGIIRHTSLADAVKIFKASTFGAIILFVISFITRSTNLLEFTYASYSVIIIHYLTSMSILVVSRFMIKLIYKGLTNTSARSSKNVLIYGAGSAGLITKDTLYRDGKLNYKVVAFMDDNAQKVGKTLEGIMVHSSNAIDGDFLSKKEISEVIISIQNISTERKREIVDKCLQFNVNVKSVPPVGKWINGELSANQIKAVRIEDLLGREEIKIHNESINATISGKCVLVTGAAGSIGSELVRQLYQHEPETIILLDQWETGLFEIENEINVLFGNNTRVVPIIADVTNEERITQVFDAYAIDLVFHAAAYKHVPMMERNPSEAIWCNVIGTKILANLSKRNHVEKFVMISTDKAVNPTNVMGASKRIAEMYVQSSNNRADNVGEHKTQFITTRFGNVLGSNGSVIPIFKKQIAAGGPVIVTHPEITRYFMTIPEACQLVLEAGVMGNGGEIFIFDMGKSVKIIDLAKNMIKLSGLELGKDIKIEFSGLREGEKLYEELLNNEETTRPTHHNKIMIANVREVHYDTINRDTDEFYDLVKVHDEMNLVAKMKEIVPEFLSNSSKFEKLDTVRRLDKKAI